MLDKPIRFATINLITYLIILGLFGFQSAMFLSIAMSIWIIVYNTKFVGLSGGIIMGIIYLLCFDSKLFYFTAGNIRFWYIYLIALYGIIAYKMMTNRINVGFIRTNLIQYLALFLLLIWSFYFLVFDDFVSKSYNIKYWIFYVGLLLMINAFFKKNIDRFQQLCDYFISISIFICVWGIIQFAANLNGIPNFQLDFYNIRPSGFFSETTWYSEFSFFGFLFILLKFLTDKSSFRYIYFIPLFFTGFMISVTRNTFVSLFIFVVFSFLCSIFVEHKFRTRIYGSWLFKLLLGLGLSVIVILLIKLNVIYLVQAKFSGSDSSAQGRLEGYTMSWDMIKNGHFLGNGFFWDTSQSTESGSALGAKSFNLFLMILHIFGFVGFAVFLVILGVYFFKIFGSYFSNKSIYTRYGIIVILCFLQMAMFAPLHQYPFGMLIVSLSTLLYLKGLYDKNNFCNSTA